jgi:hypothetical protein
METHRWFSKNFAEPISMMEEGDFYFTATGDAVAIEWLSEGGTKHVFLSLDLIEKFLAEHREELLRRTNSGFRSGEKAEREKMTEKENRLNAGRDYLMSVSPSKLTVEDCLEAFGFGRNGLKE